MKKVLNSNNKINLIIIPQKIKKYQKLKQINQKNLYINSHKNLFKKVHIVKFFLF